MTASLLGGISVCDRPSVHHRRAIMAKAMKAEAADGAVKLNCDEATNKANNGRREVMFAAAAAAICCIASSQGDAMAAEGPKPGDMTLMPLQPLGMHHRPRQSFQSGISNGAVIVMPSQDGSTSQLDESQNLVAVIEEPVLLAEEREPTTVPSSTTVTIKELETIQ
ncbi:hypothetical protein MRB53_017601 [Persea americana]|uniref:Uncharacterized protein n=1 Tax=Persea americana TaxID=3435 RepID=A0ACC2M6W3_PERAE|nr:hypothetical protein MRB53_017601 [Persea americana]